MIKKIFVILLILMITLSALSFADDESVDNGLPSLQNTLDTDELLLMNNSSRYSFDGENPTFGFNISSFLGNLVFGFYKLLVTIEIYLVVWSYKLELYKFLSGEIELLMAPITTVIFDTWKTPALLLLLLSALIKSFYSKITVVINQIVIAIVVIVISIVFLANPTKILNESENVISSINAEILKASSISDSKSTSNVDDYLVDLANQIWTVQVAKPWEILNFNNKTNASKYKDQFLKLEFESQERNDLTKELRKTVPERGVDWMIVSSSILVLQLPKMLIMILLAALNLGTDVMIVILVIVSGVVFLLALVPSFGIGVLVSWFEKIISAFAVSVIVTVGLTLLNEITAVLYKNIDSWNILGVLIIDSVIMIFLIVFRKWIIGGVKSLKYGERGVKSVMNNTPSTSESLRSMRETPSDVRYFASEKFSQAKSVVSTAKNVATLPYRAFDSALDKTANFTYNTLDRFGMAGRYKDDEEQKENNQNSNTNENESNSNSNTHNQGDKEKSYSKEQKSYDNQSKKEPKNEDEYVRYSSYNDKKNIEDKYKLDLANEDMTSDEHSRAFLNNQYKISRRDSEIEASQYVKLNGESKPISYDESTRKIMEREEMGEPLFTDSEVKKSEIHIGEMSTTQNISKTDYVNKDEKISLNKIMSDEKTYRAEDAKKESSDLNKSDSKMNEEADNIKEATYKMNESTNNDEKEVDLSTYDVQSIKDEIISTLENLDLSQNQNEITSKGHTIEDIIKNDIEEKQEVEEINKKLDNINKKVDRIEEVNHENEIKQKIGLSLTNESKAKLSEYSLKETKESLGDANEK